MSRKKTKSRADELLGECKSAEDVLGRDGLIKQLTKRALERALKGELTTHLGYEPHERSGEARGNTRNGTTPKKLLLEDGEIYLDTPRDRAGSFEPQIVTLTGHPCTLITRIHWQTVRCRIIEMDRRIASSRFNRR